MKLDERIERVFAGIRHRAIPRVCERSERGVRTAAVTVVHGDARAASVANGGVEQVCVDYDDERFVVHPVTPRPLSDGIKAYLVGRFGSEPLKSGSGVCWDRDHGYRP